MRRLLSDDGAGPRPFAEINLTNLIDVTLTLLIVFILIAPVIDQGFSLELPVAESRAIRTDDSVNLVIGRDGAIHLEGRVLGPGELAVRAREIAVRRKGEVDMIILADRELAYGRVIEVMDTLRRAGLTRLSLATSEEEGR